MAVYLYSKTCEDCTGNRSLGKIKQLCKKKSIKFEERRVLYWDLWEKEANQIIKLNPGLKLPFYYNTETGATLMGNSLTPLETLEAWLKEE